MTNAMITATKVITSLERRPGGCVVVMSRVVFIAGEEMVVGVSRETVVVLSKGNSG